MMFECCFCASLFFVRNQNNTSVLFNLSEKNRGMNKETGIKVFIVMIRFSLGGKIEKLVITYVTKYLVKLM